jgi:hypothetical protein
MTRLVIQAAGTTFGVRIRIAAHRTPHPRPRSPPPAAMRHGKAAADLLRYRKTGRRRKVCKMNMVQRFLSSNGFSPTGSLQQVLTTRAIDFL